MGGSLSTEEERKNFANLQQQSLAAKTRENFNLNTINTRHVWKDVYTGRSVKIRGQQYDFNYELEIYQKYDQRMNPVNVANFSVMWPRNYPITRLNELTFGMPVIRIEFNITTAGNSANLLLIINEAIELERDVIDDPTDYEQIAEYQNELMALKGLVYEAMCIMVRFLISAQVLKENAVIYSNVSDIRSTQYYNADLYPALDNTSIIDKTLTRNAKELALDAIEFYNKKGFTLSASNIEFSTNNPRFNNYDKVKYINIEAMRMFASAELYDRVFKKMGFTIIRENWKRAFEIPVKVDVVQFLSHCVANFLIDKNKNKNKNRK